MKVGDSLILLDKSCNKTRGQVSHGIIEKIGRAYFYVRVAYDLLRVTIQDFPIVTEDYNFIIFDSQESYNSYIEHQRSCPWRYRSAECGYLGGGYTLNNVPTTVSALDQCAKTLTACKTRFGTAVDLPFGGAPGLNTYS